MEPHALELEHVENQNAKTQVSEAQVAELQIFELDASEIEATRPEVIEPGVVETKFTVTKVESDINILPAMTKIPTKISKHWQWHTHPTEPKRPLLLGTSLTSTNVLSSSSICQLCSASSDVSVWRRGRGLEAYGEKCYD